MYIVCITFMFVRAEREAEWLLHFEAVKLMIPDIFAASRVHYMYIIACTIYDQ